VFRAFVDVSWTLNPLSLVEQVLNYASSSPRSRAVKIVLDFHWVTWTIAAFVV